MAKRGYRDEELRATRARLGSLDKEETKLMVNVLSGAVGNMQDTGEEERQPSGGRQKYTKTTPLRRVETVDTDARGKYVSAVKRPKIVAEKLGYGERVKMDVQEARPHFGIKTWGQAFRSRFSFFKSPPDMVSSGFVIIKMNNYYAKLEGLVKQVRLIFPRNNTEWTKKVRKENPFVFSVLNTLRHWNIEKMMSILGRLQSRPRSVMLIELAGIVHEFYRPLFLLEMLDPQVHLERAIRELDWLLKDDPNNCIKNGSTVDRIVALYCDINENIRYQLYPLLMKFTSSRFFPYDVFFSGCRSGILEFLGISPEEQIKPPADSGGDVLTGDAEIDEDLLASTVEPDDEKDQKSHSGTPPAVQRGLNSLEQLFPEAGWENLDSFPDLYPYFAKTLSIQKNADIIAPENPMLQALIFLRILEELFYGFRSISFNAADFNLDEINGIIDNLHSSVETIFDRMYIPRLAEYTKLFHDPPSSGMKAYAMKIRTELNYVAHFSLFPLLQIESLNADSFRKKEVDAVSSKIRTLRQAFTRIAASIERAMKAGGAAAGAHCEAINNPWDNYDFAVENPLSKRLNLLLDKKNRSNVSLVFYTISVISVLDYFLNNPDSWAYRTNPDKLFRSLDSKGLEPAVAPAAIDADAIFKRVTAQLKKK
jgi:hypothetical protein